MFRTEEGAIVGSIDVAALAELEGEKKDLSKLRKDDLVELAEAAGIDPTGATKAELVEALQSANDAEEG